MLRLLSIRNFVVVEALELDLQAGLSVLTGETGAGKSILLDALGLLLGDRFELRQLKPGADRAELAAAFDLDDAPAAARWLAEQGLDADGEVLVRRILDAQGRSRAWINGQVATLAQLDALGALLVDLHGQHAHHSLLGAEAQRGLVDRFGGFSALTGEVGAAWRAWQSATERRDAAAHAQSAVAAEREVLMTRQRELAALGVTAEEWERVNQAQTRLSHAASLIETASAAEAALVDEDAAIAPQLGAVLNRLRGALAHDPRLEEIVAMLDSARIQLAEAARTLRSYRERLDVDPAELAQVEERVAALHEAARRYRVRPEALPQLLAETEARLVVLDAAADIEQLDRAVAQAAATYRALADELSAKREAAAAELSDRVSAAMQELAMAGGRFEVALLPSDTPHAYGQETVEFQVASHPRQPLGPLAKVASGGELSRIALGIQVVASEVADVPTLIFDEVDVGIGGTVAATVGRLLQSLADRRQVLCVTHLPQVAAFADHHYRVAKFGDDASVRTDVERLSAADRVHELARMLAGSAITAKTRAHARELLEQHRRPPAGDRATR